MAISEDADIGTTTVSLTGDRDLARRLPLFDMCVLLGVAGLIAAVGFRRTEIIGLAAPFLIAATLALATWRPPSGALRIRFDRARIIEGEDVTIVVDVSSTDGIDRLELELFPADRLLGLDTMRAVTSVDAGATTTLKFTVRAEHWGTSRIDKMTVRVADRFAMFGGEIDVRPEQLITIGLPEDRIATSLDAERFRRIVGSHPSTDRGQGLEIADIRPFQHGDSSRQINWRISNRRQEPWVTLRHPDRSTTVIVIVDAHDGDDAEQLLTQRRSVAAAMALSRGHLAQHDGVGLLVVGHTLRWLSPKLGRNQLFQIADTLVAVSNAPDASRRLYRPPAISTIPHNAIVVAVSPLRDQRMVELIAEIQSRGNPVSVLMPITDEPDASRRRIDKRANIQARRLAVLEHQIGIKSLQERGVVVVPWDGDEPVLTVIQSAQRLRKSMARMRSW